LHRGNASNTEVPTSVASSKKEVKMENNEYVGTCMLIRRNEYTIPPLKTWVAPEIMCYLLLQGGTLHLRVKMHPSEEDFASQSQREFISQ